MRIGADLARDVRHALRLLARAPGFTLLAGLTLALGVGANTALFTVVNALLLRPLPYSAPERLVFLDGVLSRPDGDASFQLSYPEFADIAAAKSLSAAAPWSNAWGVSLEGGDGAARLQANFVGRGYFAVLGVQPLIGRTFVTSDHAVGADHHLVAILSEAAWRQHFGADPGIVGRDVRLQERVFTVVGIMPASYHDVALAYADRVDVWAPIERVPALFGGLDLTNRSGRLMWGVGRLADGVSLQQAAAELEAIGSRVAREYPDTNTAFMFRAAPLASSFFADARRPLWVLLGGAAFVLLIGCANVANLLLVRSTSRSREMAVRFAVGASRMRVIRQLLAESLVLALIGGMAGVLLALWLTPALVSLSGIRLPEFAEVSLDATVLSAAFAAATLCGLLFGVAPVWRALRFSLQEAMTAGGSFQIARSSRAGLALAAFEIAVAFVLATGALLMMQSFAALARTDLLFRHERLLTVRVDLPQDRYDTPARRAQFGHMARERLLQVPGVEHAVLWGPSMFARSTWVSFLAPAERPLDDPERLMVWRHSTNPGALRDLGIPMRAGRDLSDADTLNTPRVAVLSESAARRLWPAGDVVGRQLRSGSGTTATVLTVVGVAADARHRGRFRFSMGASAHVPQLDIYVPFAQVPNARMTIGVRTHGAPSASFTAVAAALAEIDPALPLYDIATLDERMRTEESSFGFAALLMKIYGALALLLAAIGVYGVLAAGVASRRRELGIRSALGAGSTRLVRDVVGEGLLVTTPALATGLAAAWFLSRTAQSVLFDVSARDPRLLALAALVVAAAAGIASVVPARRAASVDPVSALRGE